MKMKVHNSGTETVRAQPALREALIGGSLSEILAAMGFPRGFVLAWLVTACSKFAIAAGKPGPT